MLGLKPWENHVLRLANTLASNENVSFGSTEKKMHVEGKTSFHTYAMNFKNKLAQIRSSCSYFFLFFWV